MPSAIAEVCWKLKSVVNPATLTGLVNHAPRSSPLPPSVSCNAPLTIDEPNKFSPVAVMVVGKLITGGAAPMVYGAIPTELTEKPVAMAIAFTVSVAATKIGPL